MKYSFPALIVLLLFSCGSNNQEMSTDNKSATTEDSSKASQQYFPIASFLKNEIDYVDSLPVGIKKYHTRGSKSDSAYIKPDEFHRLAAEFLTSELKDSAMKQNFSESSFLDRSTNNATFFYKALNPLSEVQRVDVVTAKGDVYDEVRSVYMEKMVKEGNNTVRKKMFWRPQRHFQIISLASDTSANAEIVKVVWDNRE
jgi:hypothetical protein